MAAAARLAARARPLSRPNPAVGAIIVKDGRIIARGWTQTGGRPHAEAMALDALAISEAPGEASGATIYVTLEPCAHVSARGPACTDLLIAARPARIVIGQNDPDPRTAGQGAEALRKSGIVVDVLADDASAASLAGYLMRARHARPHVTLKLATSLDGRIALVDGSSRWITGDLARAHVHAHRAKSDAILVGGGTWRADRPRLDVRLPGLAQRSPQRLLLTRSAAPDGVRVINAPGQIAGLQGVQYLYVEGGAGAAAAFLAQDLVDTLHIYRAPILIGDGLPALGGLGLGELACAHDRWRQADTRQLGTDRFEHYERIRAG
ncbi:MAG: bifunctional diaminohydroxyphosphoribosylaminopyrimidine deaminase/5-amino-6-(5-phosphoribosylamino)uracil reductase RibD [Erythrobacter sp.]